MAKGRKKNGPDKAATAAKPKPREKPSAAQPSALIDTRVIYCGDNLDQLRKLPDACVDLIYIGPPFNSNRNYEVFWGETPPQGETRLRRPARLDRGLHRLHAAALHRALALE